MSKIFRNILPILILAAGFTNDMFAQSAKQFNLNTTNVSFTSTTRVGSNYEGFVYQNGSSIYTIDSTKVNDILADVLVNQYKIDSCTDR